MATRSVSIPQLPAKLQVFAKTHQSPEIIQFFECDTKEDLFNLAAHYPFETTAIKKNANATKTIEGYFMVGMALPTKADDFVKPVIAFYYMNEADWRMYGRDISREVDRLKKLHTETKAGFKALLGK